MKRRRQPIFLLEIVISIALIGMFSSYFLASSAKQLLRERENLIELEKLRMQQLKRMHIVADCWKKLDTFDKESYNKPLKDFDTFELNNKTYNSRKDIEASVEKKKRCYNLKLLERDPKTKEEISYHFFIEKEKSKNS